MYPVSDARIRLENQSAVNTEGDYVLYWMTAYRRLGWNFALQHAADRARTLHKPLVILEILQVDYPYASQRLHKFILEGLAERAEQLHGSSVFHYPFVEREPGEGEGTPSGIGFQGLLCGGGRFPSLLSSLAWCEPPVTASEPNSK